MNFMQKVCSRILATVCLLALVLTVLPIAKADDKEAAVQKKVQQIVSSIPSSVKTASEKALYLHDYIVKNVAYEKVGDHQSAYGALICGKAVCAGYTEAYERLLSAVGIESHCITGTATNSSGVPQGHTWTQVIIDGKCYYTDVTWDDPFINGAQDPNFVSHDYYNITMEQMHKDHTPDAESKALLPGSCNHKGLDYFTQSQQQGSGVAVFNDSTTAAQAAKYFKCVSNASGQAKYTCEFRFDGASAKSWIHLNVSDIAHCIGYTGSTQITYQVGSVSASITMSGTVNTKVSVNSVSLNQSTLKLTSAGAAALLTATVSPSNATEKGVTYTSSNSNVATVSNLGKVTAVANGTATITVTTKDGSKTAACTVTVAIPTASVDTPSVPSTTPSTPEPSVPDVDVTVPTEPEKQPEQTIPAPTDPEQTEQPGPDTTVPAEPEVSEPAEPDTDKEVPDQLPEEHPDVEPEKPDDGFTAPDMEDLVDSIVKDEMQSTDNAGADTATNSGNGETQNNSLVIIVLSVCGVGVATGVIISVVYKKH